VDATETDNDELTVRARNKILVLVSVQREKLVKELKRKNGR
jgi:hypothetical protein